ncbi:MAG: hypothetical protein AB7S38_32010 [Vulcanimicrobiota bacterium]
MRESSDVFQQDLAHLVSICRWVTRFYGEAAVVSRRQHQSKTLQLIEQERAGLADELQLLSGAATWSEATLLPLVRDARGDDARILELCDHIDGETIIAYGAFLPASSAQLQALLERHIEQLRRGAERRAFLWEDLDEV